MIIFNYSSKKELKEHIEHPLDYIETSLFGEEYLRDGSLLGANRPHITGTVSYTHLTLPTKRIV